MSRLTKSRINGFLTDTFHTAHTWVWKKSSSIPAKKELQFNCSLTIVSITRVIWPQNYSFFSSNNCSFSSIKNAVLLLSLLKDFDKKRFDVGQDRTFNSEVSNSSR